MWVSHALCPVLLSSLPKARSRGQIARRCVLPWKWEGAWPEIDAACVIYSFTHRNTDYWQNCWLCICNITSLSVVCLILRRNSSFWYTVSEIGHSNSLYLDVTYHYYTTCRYLLNHGRNVPHPEDGGDILLRNVGCNLWTIPLRIPESRKW